MVISHCLHFCSHVTKSLFVQLKAQLLADYYIIFFPQVKCLFFITDQNSVRYKTVHMNRFNLGHYKITTMCDLMKTANRHNVSHSLIKILE